MLKDRTLARQRAEGQLSQGCSMVVHGDEQSGTVPFGHWCAERLKALGYVTLVHDFAAQEAHSASRVISRLAKQLAESHEPAEYHAVVAGADPPGLQIAIAPNLQAGRDVHVNVSLPESLHFAPSVADNDYDSADALRRDIERAVRDRTSVAVVLTGVEMAGRCLSNPVPDVWDVLKRLMEVESAPDGYLVVVAVANGLSSIVQDCFVPVRLGHVKFEDCVDLEESTAKAWCHRSARTYDDYLDLLLELGIIQVSGA